MITYLVDKEANKMAFDYKKEYKEFYMPKNKPGIIEIPKMNYIAIRGNGNPNEESGVIGGYYAKRS